MDKHTATVTPPMFIQLNVKVLEDLQTGSGTGGGDIDALVQRDRWGNPVIRASHLKGLLREAGEALIALNAMTEEQLNTLLGGQGSQRAALRSTSLVVAQEATPPTCVIWGSTQRIEGNRTSAPDTLRFIEYLAAGTRLEATLRLADASLRPLLEKILNRIDRIGGGRNRGGGLVKLDWQDQSLEPSTEGVIGNAGSVVRLVLRNREPLCLPTTGHPDNLIRSYSFIRGQTLRGSLMAWAIQTGQAEHLHLFKRVAVGDALPLPEGCHRAKQVLPIPLSIMTDKPSASNPNIPWWASKGGSASAFDSLGEIPEAEEKRKRPGRHEYLCRTADHAHWQRYSPRLQVRLRNATPKRNSTEEARLFSLEEIAEDTCFQADLHCADESVAKTLIEVFSPLLTGTDWLTLGRGGQPACIESVTFAPSPPVPLEPGDREDDWTLTLTSDAIVRGERGGFLDHLDLDALCGLVGIEGQKDWQITADVVETEIVYGFNAVTGLPRVPALALRRGSCWRIQGLGSADLAQALHQQGTLGERRHEGYGRFVINVQPILADSLGKPPSRSPATADNRHEVLLAWARELAKEIGDSGPSLSQLQWLRSQALAAEMEGNLRTVLETIQNAERERPQGGRAWKVFPHDKLRESLDNCRSLDERRQLINYMVQWQVLSIKTNTREA